MWELVVEPVHICRPAFFTTGVDFASLGVSFFHCFAVLGTAAASPVRLQKENHQRHDDVECAAHLPTFSRLSLSLSLSLSFFRQGYGGGVLPLTPRARAPPTIAEGNELHATRQASAQKGSGYPRQPDSDLVLQRSVALSLSCLLRGLGPRKNPGPKAYPHNGPQVSQFVRPLSGLRERLVPPPELIHPVPPNTPLLRP